MRIAILLTCYNRKDHTINCLSLISNQLCGENYTADVFLVDDGSTDGTKVAVSKSFPSVKILLGTGSMYWNGGMRFAWQNALEGEYDCYLWINDDSMVYIDSIPRIVSAYLTLKYFRKAPGAVIGTMVDPVSKKPSYGGRISKSKWNPLKFGPIIEPGSEPKYCDFINGNFTLIPAEAVGKVGILSDVYTHSMGDFDYGLRLKKAGMTCWVAPGVFGECSPNTLTGGCKDEDLSTKERLEMMQSISQLPPVDEWRYFVRIHGGFVWPLLWLKATIRSWFPRLWVVFQNLKSKTG